MGGHAQVGKHPVQPFRSFKKGVVVDETEVVPDEFEPLVVNGVRCRIGVPVEGNQPSLPGESLHNCTRVSTAAESGVSVDAVRVLDKGIHTLGEEDGIVIFGHRNRFLYNRAKIVKKSLISFRKFGYDNGCHNLAFHYLGAASSGITRQVENLAFETYNLG